MTLRPQRSWIGPVLLIAAIAILVAACAPGGGGVDASGNPIPPSPHPPLEPAQPGADPISLLAWLFTPIFTFLFIILAAAYNLFWGLGFPGAVGWAIVVLTLVVRGCPHPALPAAAGVATADPDAPAGDARDPEALQGRPAQGPAGPAGAVQGARDQSPLRLPAPPPPAAPAVHHVFGHPERHHQPGSERDAQRAGCPGRDDRLPERRRGTASSIRTSRAWIRTCRSLATSASRRSCSRSSASGSASLRSRPPCCNSCSRG